MEESDEGVESDLNSKEVPQTEEKCQEPQKNEYLIVRPKVMKKNREEEIKDLMQKRDRPAYWKKGRKRRRQGRMKTKHRAKQRLEEKLCYAKWKMKEKRRPAEFRTKVKRRFTPSRSDETGRRSQKPRKMNRHSRRLEKTNRREGELENRDRRLRESEEKIGSESRGRRRRNQIHFLDFVRKKKKDLQNTREVKRGA